MNYLVSVHVEKLNKDKIKAVIEKTPNNFLHYETTGFITHTMDSPTEHRLLLELYNVTAKNAARLARDLFIFTFAVLGGTIIDFSLLRTNESDVLNNIVIGWRDSKATITSPLFNTRSKNDK